MLVLVSVANVPGRSVTNRERYEGHDQERTNEQRPITAMELSIGYCGTADARPYLFALEDKFVPIAVLYRRYGMVTTTMLD